jgi:hypothetical protein
LRLRELDEQLMGMAATEAMDIRSGLRLAHEAVQAFSDFQAAPDLVGHSRLLRRLFTAPFDTRELSLAVHNVNGSLLLDDFDVTHLEPELQGLLPETAAARRETLAFRRHVLQALQAAPEEVKGGLLLRSSEEEEEKEGAHHRLGDAAEAPAVGGERENDAAREALLQSLLRRALAAPEPGDELASVHSLPLSPRSEPTAAADGQDMAESSPALEDALRWQDHKHIWTFQHLRSLVRSDLAIFGDERHPAVSLRLRESDKPIHVRCSIGRKVLGHTCCDFFVPFSSYVSVISSHFRTHHRC